MRKLMFLAALILACASVSFAQSSGEYNKVEFYGGYSHNRVDTNVSADLDPAFSGVVDKREGFNGFETSITGNLSRYFGIKGDFSGHFKNKDFNFGTGIPTLRLKSSIYTLVGGVQIKDNSTETKIKPFAHAMVGIAHGRNRTDDAFFAADVNDSDTGFAGVFGGGLDIRAGKRIDVRVVQVDYNPTRLFGETQNNFRIGAGITIH